MKGPRPKAKNFSNEIPAHQQLCEAIASDIKYLYPRCKVDQSYNKITIKPADHKSLFRKELVNEITVLFKEEQAYYYSDYEIDFTPFYYEDAELMKRLHRDCKCINKNVARRAFRENAWAIFVLTVLLLICLSPIVTVLWGIMYGQK